MRRLLALVLICSPAWAYTYCAPITLTPASSGTLSDFTEKFQIVDVKVKLYPTGVIQHTDTRKGITVPTDLALTLDSTCNTITGSLTWDFEDGGTVSGTAIGNVMIPGSLTTSGLTIYAAIGDSSVSAWQGGSVGAAYDSSTSLALHFPDGTTLSAVDFSSAGNDATSINSVSAGTGYIGGGAVLSGATTNKITGFSQVIASGATAYTYECQINPTRYGSTAFGNAFFYQGPGTSQEGAAFMVYDASGHAHALRWSVSNGGSYIYSNQNVITLNAWQHVAFTYDVATSTGTFYVNGTSAGGGTSSGTPPNTGASIGYWYSSTDAGRYFAGALDECRYSSTNRAANWIATEYANQSSVPTAGAFVAMASISNSQSFVF